MTQNHFSINWIKTFSSLFVKDLSKIFFCHLEVYKFHRNSVNPVYESMEHTAYLILFHM